MSQQKMLVATSTVALIALGFAVLPVLRAQDAPDGATKSQGDQRVFELRTYHCHPGRLEALNKRFREHTNRIFKKHGMDFIGYWIPADQPDTLTYILAFPSREAATQAWAAFRADPEWNAARTASEADGPIVPKVDSVFMSPTDYSPIK